jgi:predicted TIM-barrel fold metal-dependent hydrolase
VNITPYIDTLIAANPKQLVWASDWPWLSHENLFTYADCINWIKSSIGSSATWEDILIHNPQSLFHF